MYTPIGDNFNLLDALIVSLIAVLIVFLVLVLIILISSLASKIIGYFDYKNNINPRPENKILAEDEDAVVALLTATIDYHKETKKDAKVVSIKRIEEE